VPSKVQVGEVSLVLMCGAMGWDSPVWGILEKRVKGRLTMMIVCMGMTK